MNPIKPFLDHSGVFILDGGLATELEVHKTDLNDPLWSAKVLIEQPELLNKVNYDYLVAGSDMVSTATYQATFEGFSKKGFSHKESESLFQKAIDIATSARDRFWADPENRKNRIKPIVVASIGPYGAYLADGSEYSGQYGISEDALVSFHRKRLKFFVNSSVDLIAFETIPSLIEAKAIIRLLNECPNANAWLSFSCKDGMHLSDGTPFQIAAKLADISDQIIAVGVNCLTPENASPLLGKAAAVTDKPLIVYPNSGEHWNAEKHCWEMGASDVSIHDLLQVWFTLGARLIGGCCRTGPDDIKKIKASFINS